LSTKWAVLSFSEADSVTIFQYFEVQGQSHEAMKYLAKSIGILAGQLNRLKQVPKSNELSATIIEFPRMMEEVVDF